MTVQSTTIPPVRRFWWLPVAGAAVFVGIALLVIGLSTPVYKAGVLYRSGFIPNDRMVFLLGQLQSRLESGDLDQLTATYPAPVDWATVRSVNLRPVAGDKEVYEIFIKGTDTAQFRPFHQALPDYVASLPSVQAYQDLVESEYQTIIRTGEGEARFIDTVKQRFLAMDEIDYPGEVHAGKVDITEKVASFRISLFKKRPLYAESPLVIPTEPATPSGRLIVVLAAATGGFTGLLVALGLAIGRMPSSEDAA